MKKLLLFLTIIFLGAQVIFAQVPANDLIQNATLIEEAPFIRTNVRLDLASVGDGGQNGCDLGTNYKMVYYKFTATSDNEITITIEDTRDLEIGQTFAIIYSAADLNATSDSQLTNVSPCNFGPTTNFVPTIGTNYYILVHRINGESVYSRVTIDTPQTVPANERTALLDLYNNTGGANWINNGNWATSNPVSTFHGVTVKNGQVSKILLDQNNLNGTIPSSITGLQFAEEIDLSANKVSGEIPDFSTISTLEILDLDLNDFSFQDIETYFTNNNSLTEFYYKTQNKRDAEASFDGVLGNNYNLVMTPIVGTNVQYQWYKKRYNYFDESDEIIPGATSNTYTINVLTEDDMDTYTCKASSSAIPDLVIERNSIDIKGEVSQLQKDALIAIYNSTNGASWNDNTNWLSTEPVSEWYGVTVSGNKVTSLDFYNNNLTGTLPPEIGDLLGLQLLSFFLGNSINGTLPPEIGNLTELRVLSFEYNNFTGTIPASYSNLTKLRGFWFNNNQLSGSVPTFVNTFSNLVFMDISFNNFSGLLPDFSGLQKLIYLYISNNHFLPNDFSDQFNDYLNLQNSWNSSYFYSPQYTLDIPGQIESTEGDDVVLTLIDVSATNKLSSNNFTANNYQWFKDNVAISGANANSYTIMNAQISDSGVYHCDITNPDMPDLVIRRENITVNVGILSVDEELQKLVKVYPNPANDIIDISLPQQENVEISIFDIQGRKILTSELDMEDTALDISHLQTGIYMLRLKVADKIAIKKIIKK
jgi:hypothetical protein